METVDSNYNFTVYDKYLNKNLDVVILRLGDNVRFVNPQDTLIWKVKYQKLVQYFSKSKPVIISTSSWYPNHKASKIIKDISTETNNVYVDIHHLFDDKSNWAESEREFKVPAVGSHPGDKGMKAIADLLLETIDKHYPQK